MTATSSATLAGQGWPAEELERIGRLRFDEIDGMLVCRPSGREPVPVFRDEQQRLMAKGIFTIEPERTRNEGVEQVDAFTLALTGLDDVIRYERAR